MKRSPSRLAATALATAVLTGACSGEPGAFAPRGPHARDVNLLFWAMTGLGTAVLVLVVVVLILVARGNRATEDEPDRPPDAPASRRARRLVLGGGVVLPVAVLVPLTVAMLVVGARVAHRAEPVDLEIHLIGHQFWWEVRYPDQGIVTANEIHLPVGQPVRFRMETADVIHSVWAAQLAGKVDMIPGEETELRLQADEPGEYLGHCAEYCGLQHARMRFLIVAQTPEEFERWLRDQAADAPPPDTAGAARGAEVFGAAGCASCHTVRGTDAAGLLGPDLTHLGTRRTLGAATVPNGPAALEAWVLDPHEAKPGVLMPPLPPLGEQELSDLVAYLESLR